MSALRISRPGEPTRLVVDRDPWLDLTPWQRRCGEAVLARRGNRTYAARDLGVSITAVQQTVQRLEAMGVRIPAGKRRGPDLRPRKGTRPACGAPIRTGVCARGTGHAGAHRSLEGVIRNRATNARYDARRRAA